MKKERDKDIDIEERLCYACWLHAVPGMGNKTIRKLAEYAGGEKEIYSLPEKEIEAILTTRQAEAFRRCRREKEPEQLYKTICKKGIVFAPWFSGHYPKQLLQIPDAPYAVYMLGRPMPENLRLVAVIGARDCSGYGERMAKQIGRELAESNVGLVSGLAKGVDGIGQWAAIEAGGYTVGVPGCGVDVCYPRENRRLYERCSEQGLLLSEYVPGAKPEAWHFPARNRLISGLSDTVIVVEAREKSGTLITVDMALEQGREVFAVPGRLTDSFSAGCNRLIGQGAQLFTSVGEMLDSLGTGWGRTVCVQQEQEKSVRENGVQENGVQENDLQEKGIRENSIRENRDLASKLFCLCDYYPKSVMELFDELKKESGYQDISIQQVIEVLLEMTISGQISEKGQNYYYRRN